MSMPWSWWVPLSYFVSCIMFIIWFLLHCHVHLIIYCIMLLSWSSCALPLIYVVCCSSWCVCITPCHLSLKPWPCIITSPFLLLSCFLQVTLFPPPLMFIYFLMILLHALYLSIKFHPFWSCFGWVQKWSKFEFNSNMIYFSASKNAQLNFIKFHITPGSWGYFHISHATLLSLCILFSLFSVWRKKEREECIQERGFTWTPAF